METMVLNRIRVSDVTGTKLFGVGSVPRDSNVGDMLQQVLSKLPFPRNDSTGRPIHWRARLEREGRHLEPGELVGDALREDDEVQLHPSVDAGRGIGG